MGAGGLPAGGVLRCSRVIGDDLVMVLGGALEAIEEGQACMAGHLDAGALGARAVNRLEVVFEELIANVVRHGFSGAAGHSILVAVGPRPGLIRLAIEDDGRPFDPFTDAPEPPGFDFLETAQIGGLGVQVVRRFAASTAYDNTPASDLWSEFVDQGGRPVNRVTVTIATGA